MCIIGTPAWSLWYSNVVHIRVYRPSVGHILGAVVVLVFGVGLYALLTFEPRAEAQPLPNIVLEDIGRNPVALREIANGKITIINVWASWCPSCTQELPDFVRLKAAYPDVAIIAINRKESPKDAQAYLHKQGIEGALTVLLDQDDEFYRAINGVGMPETVVVNRDGFMVAHRHGPMSFVEMQATVESLRSN